MNFTAWEHHAATFERGIRGFTTPGRRALPLAIGRSNIHDAGTQSHRAGLLQTRPGIAFAIGTPFINIWRSNRHLQLFRFELRILMSGNFWLISPCAAPQTHRCEQPPEYQWGKTCFKRPISQWTRGDLLCSSKLDIGMRICLPLGLRLAAPRGSLASLSH